MDVKGNVYVFLLKRYIRNILISLDQTLNVITFGDEVETISSRLGKSQRGDFGKLHKALSYPLAKLVDFIADKFFNDPNHCFTNIEENTGNDALLKIYKKYRKQKNVK